MDDEIVPFVLFDQQRPIDNLFVVGETKPARCCGAHLQRFPSRYFLPFSRPRPQLALSACRPCVSQANFAIKQSDARTAIVMTVKRGKGRKGREIEPVRAQITTNLKRCSSLMHTEERRGFRGKSRLLHNTPRASSVHSVVLKVDRPFARWNPSPDVWRLFSVENCVYVSC